VRLTCDQKLVGPPSSVIASRDTLPTGNQPQQLYGTIYSSSSSIQHDSQEVKQTTQAGITKDQLCDWIVARFKRNSIVNTSTVITFEARLDKFWSHQVVN